MPGVGGGGGGVGYRGVGGFLLLVYRRISVSFPFKFYSVDVFLCVLQNTSDLSDIQKKLWWPLRSSHCSSNNRFLYCPNKGRRSRRLGIFSGSGFSRSKAAASGR